ncbi:hypothetical protein [Caulobacter sp. NIBR2454]|uniref:hypothetical protein n=1 Tax=Caulobacter sp. NIBR2454 TaxID=3015996 RepID=UPI0022B6C97F|nr:hypothetical protein [Caulobacter sp. NIBR2454]
MRLLVVCLVGLALSAPLASGALAENWQPVPGDPTFRYDQDFMRVDEQSGLVVLRYASGGRAGPYASWPTTKSPIMMFALDCAADGVIDLGLDYKGDGKLPRNWRAAQKDTGISAMVGPAGKMACEKKDSLPKAAL